jgi:transcriptional regulator with XRE-family HTH domain
MTLRERRIAKGYRTVSALAEVINVPLVSLYKWENAVCLPRHQRLQSYAYALDCTVDDIIKGFHETKGSDDNSESESEDQAEKTELGETQATLTTSE